ncbi:hypothetical protein BRADI_4g07027v3 [Brachypodium distachyon]|nr:hypothetical protein BRADI_4g07027v3 [Brachypodium distachyon]KQJ86671.1 hypothetical protein BRADI_4g07027v3 [Brachypodium distachyon]
MIVIDDIRKAEVWLDMKSAFPKGETSSVIITTTDVQSVATACSSGGYVYKLRGLNSEDSKKLFRRNVLETEHDCRCPDLERYSDEILTNCGGLPLAIISVARFLKLQGKNNLERQCKQLACHGMLGKHLTAPGNHEAFKKLQSVLVESYEGLPSYAYECDLKTCLLSMSMFPRDSDINRKSLARRWIAEGLVPNSEQNDLTALAVFHTLIDGSIIEPSPAKDQQVPSLKPWMKRCRVHGVMLEFLINKSISKNFASPRTKGNFLSAQTSRCSIRWLSLDSTGSKNVSSEDLRSVRSLNMVGCKRPLDLGKCKHLRLLDLDKCTGVNLQVLKSICKLVLIKYLNLRGTDVSVLPQEMEKLCHLEMLDVRDAKMDPVIKLPLEVILLPRLAYLFGKFELPDHIKDEAAEKIGRQMHTLAGFVISNSTINGGPAMAADSGGPASSNQRWATTIKRKVIGASSRKDKILLLSGGTGSTNNSNDSICITTAAGAAGADNTSKSHGFQYILHHMKQLKKVKIWWRSRNEGEAPSEQLTEALVSFLQERFSLSDGLESLSLHFENQCMDFLDKLKLKERSSITLESIKLHGKLSKLPGFITEAAALPSLQEVHLSLTGLCSKDLLVLKRLSYLKYLKIVEDSKEFGDDSLDVGNDDFRSLKGLFVQAKKLPQVNITREAMKYLTTLQLICDDVQGFCASNIANFKNLDQVVLKSSLQDAKKDEWKAKTKDHSNRPRLEFLLANEKHGVE